MRQYLDLLDHILEKGAIKSDRTGTGTKSVFGYQMRFDLSEGFPLVTTKKLHLKSIVYELLWFLKGETNIRYLCENGVRIWNDWPYQKFKDSVDFDGCTMREFGEKVATNSQFAEKWGDLGPVYGSQWRAWPTPDGGHIDQISNLMESLKMNKDSRRHIVCAWNVGEIDQMTLPPCHCLFQFYVADGKLSCQLYQRSADVFLGVPFNIASYAALTMMMAKVLGYELGDFVHTLGDAHIYSNHFDQVKLQLTRDIRPLPQLEIGGNQSSIFDFEYEDFKLLNYNPHPHIKGLVAV